LIPGAALALTVSDSISLWNRLIEESGSNPRCGSASHRSSAEAAGHWRSGVSKSGRHRFHWTNVRERPVRYPDSTERSRLSDVRLFGLAVSCRLALSADGDPELIERRAVRKV